MKLGWGVFVALMVALGLSACADHEGNMGFSVTSTSVDGAALTAFQNGFYKFAQTQNCAKCHANSTRPLFASPDLSLAYSEARGNQIGTVVPLIDFNDPDSSIIATYAGNSHCNDTPCSSPANTDTVKPLLEAWAQAELGSGTGGTASVAAFSTGPMAVPANLPLLTSGKTQVLRFDLSKLNPAVGALSNAIFEVQVQLANATEYRFSQPKIGGNSSAVTITGIHIYVKKSTASGIGTEDGSQGVYWDQVSVTAAVFPLPNPLPTGTIGATALTTTAIYSQVLSTSDELTVGFDKIEVAP